MSVELKQGNGAIWIVDDSAEDAEMLTRSLIQIGLGNPIRHITTGSEAISLLEELQQQGDRDLHSFPSVMFLDLRLPDMSGFEVMKWISKQALLRRTLVVVHSGYAGLEDIKALYRAGANTFLHKPGDPDELKTIIQSFSGHFATERGGLP